MTTFAQKVEGIAKANDLKSTKAIAGFLGVNASTLGSALKKDAYAGKLVAVVDAAIAPSKPDARKSPRNRLNDLRKTGTGEWAASLDGDEIVIRKIASKQWAASRGKVQLVEETTFKGIINALRVIAAKMV